MRDEMPIGCTPSDEDCAQLGVMDDYPRWAKTECQAYIRALRKKFGEEPDGARLRVKSNPHDFGTYYEVVCAYDTDNEEATAYALKVEEGLATWEEAGMVAPVIYDGHAARENPAAGMQ